MHTREASFRLWAIIIICFVGMIIPAFACGTFSETNTEPWTNPCKEVEMTKETKAERSVRINQIIERNREVFEQHPNYLGVGHRLATVDSDTVLINVIVSDLVDQERLPEKSRIPECIEGVPVQIEKIRDDFTTSGN